MMTSNFPLGHPLYSDKNKRKLGFFKSETGPYFPSQFCGLRSKMYSLWTPTSDDPAHTFTKAKGVPKHYVKKRVRHEQYLHVLRGWNTTTCTFRTFRSKNHAISTRKLSKVCLSCIDDKRYLLSDGITSLPYGHRDIPPGAHCPPPSRDVRTFVYCCKLYIWIGIDTAFIVKKCAWKNEKISFCYSITHTHTHRHTHTWVIERDDKKA